jgi:hypothetical protein
LPVPAQGVPPDHLYGVMNGHWVGTLEYKDYSNPDKRVTLPTILDITPSAKGGVAMHYIYDDGPGKTVTGDDTFIFSTDNTTVDWTGAKQSAPEIFAVQSFDHNDAARVLTIVLQREGDDDRKPATIRETIRLTETGLTILKEVRPTGQDFSFRHVYRLTRK